MRTSRDVYNRLLHDKALGLADVTIVGYLDRFKGSMELELRSFSKSDVPMHRVIYFRHAADFLWHRETRLDDVFHSTPNEDAHTPQAKELRKRDFETAMANLRERTTEISISRPAVSGLRRGYVHHFSDSSSCWVASASCLSSLEILDKKTEEMPEGSSTLQVAIINVMNDAFLSDSVRSLSVLRWRAISREIVSTRPHFFVLTEVTEAFAAYLLKDSEVRSLYSASDSSASAFTTIIENRHKTGQMLLIRRDVAVQNVYCADVSDHSGKCFIFTRASMKSGVSITLCGLHLSSGYNCPTQSEKYTEKRRTQLQEAIKLTKFIRRPNDVCVIAGDFNFRGESDELACSDLLENYMDAGSGPTFDPKTNGLAAMVSKDKIPKRLDRIYVNSEQSDTSVSRGTSQLLINNTITVSHAPEHDGLFCPPGVYASDHFGLLASFRVAHTSRFKEINQTKWSYSTALAFIPNKTYQSTIDENWRKKYDPAYEKWPAHVNLIYPFVEIDALEKVCVILKDYFILRSVRSNSIISENVNQVDLFKHKETSTVILKFESDNIALLRSDVLSWLKKMMFIKEDGNIQPKESYIPHMTIAKLKNSGDTLSPLEFSNQVSMQLTNLMKNIGPMAFSSISVLQRVDGKVVLFDDIPLSSNHEDAMSRTLELVHALFRCIFDEEARPEMTVIGSAALLKERTTSDLDIAARFSNSSDNPALGTLEANIRELLSDNASVRLIDDASNPVIHINCHQPGRFLPIDILLGNAAAIEDAIGDTTSVTTFIEKLDDSAKSVFKDALVALKAWAKAVHLTGKSWGLFGGIAWTLMLCCVISDYGRVGDDSFELLRYFFQTFSTFNWTHSAVTLLGTKQRQSIQGNNTSFSSRSSALVIKPFSKLNYCSGVGPVTLFCFSKECQNVLQACYSSEKGLRTPPLVISSVRSKMSYRFTLLISITLLVPEFTEKATGWLRGKFLNFEFWAFQKRKFYIRPLTVMQWKCISSNDQLIHKGSVTCGVITEMSQGSFEDWQRIVSDAENSLRNEYLKWERRPQDSTISLELHMNN